MLKRFESGIIAMLQKFVTTQQDTLETVAKEVVRHLQLGGRFFAVGTGHSHMVGEEFYARAGGLACIQLIAPMELTLGEHPLKSTMIERIAEYAHVIISQYQISENDIVMITSNSGRNSMPVEMARQGMEVPVFLSANVDAGDAWNERIMKEYYHI